MTSHLWYPVVHGRTRSVDRWWRVLPEGLTEGESAWLRQAVQAVVAGGRDLAVGPRFLLADEGRLRLVGVACQAGLLSRTMATDTGKAAGRPLYTFVGWMNRSPSPPAPVPGLPAWQAHLADWAAPVYDHWVGQDWDRPARKLNAPNLSRPGEAPWEVAALPADGAWTPARTSPPGVRVVPAARAEAVWNAAVAGPGPVLLTTGWPGVAGIPRGATMTATCDVAEELTLPPPATPVTEREPEAVKEEATNAEATKEEATKEEELPDAGDELLAWAKSVLARVPWVPGRGERDRPETEPVVEEKIPDPPPSRGRGMRALLGDDEREKPGR
ncbi:hypothetical protein KIH74_30265 [Kineosporia sp. J2-2]|uniref:Uncharacterized protein n=1 Tax=Kineosporia corallincola TaxID=2835133 RepID=A0ABS5TQ79_9ACTN|nr:hypothetical protein [Kineosporia corallincola]MBT0773268.1 hypothetical protein [Kineosporia corallincola]